MLPLRYPWVWSILGWLLVACVTAGSVLPGGVVRGFPASDKLVHGVSYFLLMIWFAGLYQRRRHGLIALTLLALGVGLEFIQGRIAYRYFDPADLLANAVGVLIGLALSVWALAGWCQRVERAFLSADPNP